VIRVLVTGASGFVGRVLCTTLTDAGYAVRAAVRRSTGYEDSEGTETVAIGDLATAEWSAALRGVDCVVHAAARAHTGDARSRPELYLQTNAHGTRRLAVAAVRAGIGRFVYLSSVKVNGEGAERPYGALDEPRPQDPYGESKLLGEKFALQVAAGSAMGVVIVRSPLVYGPGVRANFARLLRWVERGWPLPLAAIHNRRSLVNVWNLCDLLQRLLIHTAAPGRIWMVSDAEDLSTAELVRRIARELHRPARLFPVPATALRIAGAMLGASAEIARLCDSLTVDIAATRRELEWSPPVSVTEGLARTVLWYRSEAHARA
jgi:nucleoside-diphosphate-sugar epimerase